MTRTIHDFVSEHGITFTAKRVDHNPHTDPDDWSKTARHWFCAFGYEGSNAYGSDLREFTVHFSQGSAHTEPPTAHDVLDCLASDASSWENSADFEDWAENMGHDTDSRKAEKTYNTIGDQAKRLKVFLGHTPYFELLQDVERL